ncbi:hypothetical protein QUF84_24455 [Fictibacillus enclensis]|uniref:hypothetical protein n=1 Tax=Fictibacillus enclensis TaxID=1017270 RepID=UPI0025A26C88|nr:hypothetical protein [Fictibacillus enclensis]MDM5340352.1 hypothetical protein [Fictibacillus enclensis]
MEKEKLLSHVTAMIVSSAKVPKHMAVSPVKMADLYGVKAIEVEKGLDELVDEGKLRREQLQDYPHYMVYLLP